MDQTTRQQHPWVIWDLKPESISDSDWIEAPGVEYRRANPIERIHHPSAPGYPDTWHNGWVTCGQCRPVDRYQPHTAGKACPICSAGPKYGPTPAHTRHATWCPNRGQDYTGPCYCPDPRLHLLGRDYTAEANEQFLEIVKSAGFAS